MTRTLLALAAVLIGLALIPAGASAATGSSPRGWKADVAYVRSSENRSHGATLGNRLRRFCDGTRFRYVFR